MCLQRLLDSTLLPHDVMMIYIVKPEGELIIQIIVII